MSFALFSSTTFIFPLLIDNVEAAAYIRGIRIDLNRDLTEAKSRIKENAIKLFMEHLDTLLEADKDASDTFKNGFNGSV
jgi:molecular chaperone GrpE (heat shock protein)